MPHCWPRKFSMGSSAPQRRIFSCSMDYRDRMSAMLLADESPESSELQVILKPGQAGLPGDSLTLPLRSRAFSRRMYVRTCLIFELSPECLEICRTHMWHALLNQVLPHKGHNLSYSDFMLNTHPPTDPHTHEHALSLNLSTQGSGWLTCKRVNQLISTRLHTDVGDISAKSNTHFLFLHVWNVRQEPDHFHYNYGLKIKSKSICQFLLASLPFIRRPIVASGSSDLI